MTPEFVEQFTARLESLVADLRYYHKPTGENVAPRVVMTQVSNSADEGDIYPFLCWSTAGFSFADRNPREFEIKIVLGVLADKDGDTGLKVQGYGDISQFATTVAKGLMDDKYFRPFKIKGEVRGRIGDENGRQPLPTFWAELNFTMIAAR